MGKTGNIAGHKKNDECNQYFVRSPCCGYSFSSNNFDEGLAIDRNTGKLRITRQEVEDMINEVHEEVNNFMVSKILEILELLTFLAVAYFAYVLFYSKKTVKMYFWGAVILYVVLKIVGYWNSFKLVTKI